MGFGVWGLGFQTKQIPNLHVEGGLQLQELLVLLHERRALELLFGCKKCVRFLTGVGAFGVCVPLWPAGAAGWGSLVHV